MGADRSLRKGVPKGFPGGRGRCIVAQSHRDGRSQTMNAQSDISMKTDEVLRVELEVFRQQHRDLDEAIHAMQERMADPLTMQRLKKQKLRLKDLIARIEDRLTPDIIA